MSARSFVIQLQSGVGQAILPDHRKMVPGVQYTVDAETFSKISLGARQNIIKVVNVNLDSTGAGSISTASGTFVPAQASSGVNAQISPLTLLTTVATSPTAFSLAGFSAQGWSAGGEAGTGTGVGTPAATLSGSATNVALTGPDGSRYILAYNGTASTISGGWVTVWQDELNRYISTASGITYQVNQDGLGTDYVISSNTTLSGTAGSVTTIGTKQGAFAGVTLTSIPAGNFGFIQIEGTCPNVAVPSGTAAGSTVGVNQNNNAGVASVFSAATRSVNSAGTVSGTALSNNVFGTTLTTAVSGTGAQYFAVVDLRSRRVKKPYTRVLNKN
jgi:hypothetical protein